MPKYYQRQICTLITFTIGTIRTLIITGDIKGYVQIFNIFYFLTKLLGKTKTNRARTIYKELFLHRLFAFGSMD